MKIIVGLGNPGKKYEMTRHNIGFMTIDRLISESKYQILNKSRNSKFKKRYDAEAVEMKINAEKILLIKPQTYMNESGITVKKYVAYYNLYTTNLIVVHDDVDLTFGTIRIQCNGGSAGHHGIESISREMGTNDFIRVRVGVGRNNIIPVVNFVLMPFTQDEEKKLPAILARAIHAITAIVKHGLEKAMSEYN